MAVQEITQSPAQRRIGQLLAVVGWSVLITVALLEILPFLFTVSNSFKCLPAVQKYPAALIPAPPFGAACIDAGGSPVGADEVSGPVTFHPATQGYEEIFDQDFGRWAFNTAFIAVTVTVLRLLFDSLAGYALARMRFPGNRLMFYMVLGTMMVPGIVLVIPRFIILKSLGMLNSYQGLIIPVAVDTFGIFLMKQFFESLPHEIEEAAQVDGASYLTMFFRVILPMATPALTALAIFSFQGTWNDFLMPLIIVAGNRDLWTLPLGLNFLMGAYGETLRWHTFLAGSVMTTLPLALVFFFFQRYFVEGVSYSGLKG